MRIEPLPLPNPQNFDPANPQHRLAVLQAASGIADDSLNAANTFLAKYRLPTYKNEATLAQAIQTAIFACKNLSQDPSKIPAPTDNETRTNMAPGIKRPVSARPDSNVQDGPFAYILRLMGDGSLGIPFVKAVHNISDWKDINTKNDTDAAWKALDGTLLVGDEYELLSEKKKVIGFGKSGAYFTQYNNQPVIIMLTFEKKFRTSQAITNGAHNCGIFIEAIFTDGGRNSFNIPPEYYRHTEEDKSPEKGIYQFNPFYIGKELNIFIPDTVYTNRNTWKHGLHNLEGHKDSPFYPYVARFPFEDTLKLLATKDLKFLCTPRPDSGKLHDGTCADYLNPSAHDRPNPFRGASRVTT